MFGCYTSKYNLTGPTDYRGSGKIGKFKGEMMRMSKLKKVLAMLLALAMTFTVCATGVAAAQKEDETPTILVHGFNGYGPDVKASDLIGNYWGGFAAGNLAETLRNKNQEVYEANVSPLESNWDRACELYACIKGGRVDYGAAHSAEKGHSRYGRTYPGLYPQWDNDHPVNVWGHSLGAPTERVMISLLYYGNEAEQAAAPNDCSDLFKGNGKTMVNACMTVSGVNNGTSLADLGYDLLAKPFGEASADKLFSYVFYAFGFAMSQSEAATIDLTNLWDPQLEAWGFTPVPGESLKSAYDRVKASGAFQTKDMAFYDMTSENCAKLNAEFPDSPNTYYFARPTQCTHAANGGPKQVQDKTALLLGPLSTILGQVKCDRTGGGWKDSYYANDGMVNTELTKAPFNNATSKVVTTPERGAWVNLPVWNLEHAAAVGFYFPLINETVDIVDGYSKMYIYIASLD